MRFNFRTAVVFVLLIALLGGGGFWFWERWRENRFDPQIVAAAQKYQVPPELVKSVIWRESRFHPDSRGTRGELGLMQVREPAAREWAAAEKIEAFQFQSLLDPSTNTLAGTWYLAKLLRRYAQTDNPGVY